MNLFPCLKTAEVRQLLSGPESFAPDSNFIIGEAPNVNRLIGIEIISSYELACYVSFVFYFR